MGESAEYRGAIKNTATFLVVAAVCVCVYSMHTFFWRRHRIRSGKDQGIDDPYGPVALAGNKCVYLSVCLSIYLSVCLSVYLSLYIWIDVYRCIYIMHACMHACIHACIHTTYMHAYIHVCVCVCNDVGSRPALCRRYV